jgi:TRAP-type C4-dicarboxylate transport system substrate-binding protein
VSAQPVNVIQGAFILRKQTWESLSKDDQKALESVVGEQSAKTLEQFRGDDDRSYKKMTTRGITAVDFENQKQWEEAGQKLRKMLVGRTYTKELLERVEAITKKYN